MSADLGSMSVQDSIQVTTLLLKVNEQIKQLENKNKRSIRQKPIDDNNIPIVKMQNAFEKNNRVDLSSWIEGQCNRYKVQDNINPACLQLFKIVKDGRKNTQQYKYKSTKDIVQS
eukprot:Pgem_evm1s13558